MGISNNVNKGVIYLNGEKMEIDITDLTVEYDRFSGYDFARNYMGDWSEPATMKVQVNGIARKIIEGKDMAFGECEDKCAEGKSLATKYNELDLDDNTKKLRKHKLVHLDGTLTERGKDFLLNVLLEQNEDEVVEALEAIEKAEKEDNKKSCD